MQQSTLEQHPGTTTNRFFARLMRSWSWVLLIAAVIAIKWIAIYPGVVERYYTYGLYPAVSRALRFLFGWIPISLGDILYGVVLAMIIWKAVRFFRRLFRRQVDRAYFITVLQQGIFFILLVYVLFNLLWGLNYNRQGIATQLGLEVKTYSNADLDTLTERLLIRLNDCATHVSHAQRDSFNRKKDLFAMSRDAYHSAEAMYPFLAYRPPSVKPSIFSYAGNYLGFQGYYNPFSGEAQVNTTIPHFLEPFVTTHEMAHQLGYGKENEANFVAFLACRTSKAPALLYSMYFDLFNYAVADVAGRDTAVARVYLKRLNPQVVTDIRAYRAFYQQYRTPVETFISWGYGHFLKANNQPGGKRTYNEVVAWLIAYYKKFGIDALD